MRPVLGRETPYNASAAIDKDLRKVLVMLGLALAARGKVSDATLVYDALEFIVTDLDTLLWLQASYKLLFGEGREALEKLRLSQIEEGSALLSILEEN